MALPPKLKLAIRPIVNMAKLIGPTGVGVLLSVGAHATLLAFGPRTDFSFAALTQADQAADGDTIVPVVQLTPAEQASRLPSFAQPRRAPNPSGLSSFGLPSGLPLVPNANIPRGQSGNSRTNTTAGNRTNQPTRTTAQTQQRSPVTQTPQRISLGNTFPIASTTRRPNFSVQGTGQRGNQSLVVVPTNTQVTPTQPSDNNSTTTAQPTASTPSEANTSPLPNLESSQTTLTFEEALARANENNPPDIGEQIPNGAQESESDPDLNVEEGIEIPTQPPESITLAPAQGNLSQLREGFRYDETDVSLEAAEENQTNWLTAITEAKGEGIAAANAELTVDSNFKVCKEIPPGPGLVGVVVNPDGTKENLELLRSVGYDIVNREALDAVAYADFGTPEVTTSYQVEIDVLYEPQGCVEGLPGEEGVSDGNE